MKLRSTLLIARRDYLAYVARRRFWIGLLLTPAILLGIIFVLVIIQRFQSPHRYAVVDHSGWVLKAVNERIAAKDYAELLSLAAAHANSHTTGTLPRPLAAVASNAAKLDDSARVDLAKALAAEKPVPQGAAAQAIWEQRLSLIRWYQGLSSKKARAVDRRLTIARYRYVPTPASVQQLRQQITRGTLFGYFVIPASPLNSGAKFTYASRNLTDTSLINWFTAQVNSVVQARKIASIGLPQARALWLKTPVNFHSQLVTETGARLATGSEKAAQWLPIGYVYLLFIAIVQIAQLLMMSTIEEKSSRIAETLLATVEPADVMAGKTLGIAAVGTTLVTCWLVIILGLLAAFGGALPIGNFAHALVGSISAWNISWFIVYFILGFLLYSAILGAIGAAVNNIQEAQPYVAPVMLFLVIPLIIMVPVVKDPAAAWARALSYFPPLTPFLMVNRSAAPPPLVDYLATTALLVVTVALALYASGRIFRIGLLNTGAPPKIKELLGWLRTPGHQ